MSAPRFTVRWWIAPYPNLMRSGYAVYDRGHRITHTWPDHAEAERHRKNIAKYYLRWGW